MSVNGNSERSTSSRGWFDSTMGVISNMAPRPSTPVQQIQQQLPMQRGCASAPTSPARGISRTNSNGSAMNANGSFFQLINRLPSQDSLDRSIHNDTGSGKSSAAQIIRDLRHSNANLTARTASMEADFMNQIQDITRKFEDKFRRQEETLHLKNKQVQTLENRCKSVENRIREKDQIVTKLREECAFQRHNISDLKNQLFQLNKELELSEQENEKNRNKDDHNNESNDDDDQNDEQKANDWKLERQALLQEMEAVRRQSDHENTQLREQLSDVTEQLRQLIHLQRNMEVQLCAKDDHIQNLEKAAIANKTDEPQLSDSSSSSSLSDQQCQQLEKTRDALADSSHRLQATETELVELRQEKDRAVNALQDELANVKAKWQKGEEELLKQIETLTVSKKENANNPDAETNINLNSNAESGSKEFEELRKQLEIKDKAMQSLHEDALNREEEVAALEAKLNQMKVDAENQELYRRDEAEDLRVLHDAQEEEIERLRKELEDANNELELRDQELEEKENEYKAKFETEQKQAENKIEQCQGQKEQNEKLLQNLKTQLDESNQNVIQAQDELLQSKKEHEIKMKRFQELIEDVTKEKEHAQNQLEVLTQEREQEIMRAVSMEQETPEKKSRVEDLQLKLAEKENAEQKALLQAHNASQQLQAIKRTWSEEKRDYKESQNRLKGEIEILQQSKDQELHDYKNKLEELRMQLEQSKLGTSVGTGEPTSDQESNHNNASQSSSSRSHQSSGEVEADLRKEINSLKLSEENIKIVLQTLKREKEMEIKQMREKLDDRDTTISALVKSNMSLESRINTMRENLKSIPSSTSQQGVETVLSASPSSPAGTANHGNEKEVTDLRSALADYRQVEERLSHEVSLLKKELHFAESEIARLTEEQEESMLLLNNNNGSFDNDQNNTAQLQHFRRQIQERDDAVSTLVQQSMSQEKHVRNLKHQLLLMSQELETVRTEKRKYSSQALREELKRLQQESEIFAGQIIEQDEEIEALREQMTEKEHRVAHLTQEVSALTKKAEDDSINVIENESLQQQINDMKVEINHLKENNEGKVDQINTLQKQLDECKNSEMSMLSMENEKDKELEMQLEVGKVKDELRLYQDKCVELQHDLSKSMSDLKRERRNYDTLESKLRDELESMMQHQADSMNDQLEKQDHIIMDLENTIRGKEETIDSLRKQVKSLQQQEVVKQLPEQHHEQDSQGTTEMTVQSERTTRSSNSARINNRSVATPVRDEEKEQLLIEVEDLKQEIRALENELQILSELNEANGIEDPRKIVDEYEEKLSVLALEKDLAVERVRKELTDLKRQAKGDFEEMEEELQKFEMENIGLRQEIESIVHQKNSKILTLEQTLQAQEQLVQSMKSEMDHLQGSMESNVLSRREEYEDMEKEVLNLSSRCASQEREITALKMQLEETKLQHMTENVKLRDTIASLESQIGRHERNTSRTRPSIDESRIGEVMERLEKLKWRNNSIQEENIKLRTRLGQAEDEIKATKNDKYRTASLEAQVGLLTKQVKELEGQNKQLESQNKHLTENPKPPVPRAVSVDGQRPIDIGSNMNNYHSQQQSKPAIPQSPARTPLRGLKERVQDSPLRGFLRARESPLRGTTRRSSRNQLQDSPLRVNRNTSSKPIIPDSPSGTRSLGSHGSHSSRLGRGFPRWKGSNKHKQQGTNNNTIASSATDSSVSRPPGNHDQQTQSTAHVIEQEKQ